jgi:hypothetical protein
VTTPLDPSRAHADAIVGLLRASVTAEDYPVYVGEVTDPEDDITYPYLVVWPSPATRPVNSLAGYDGAVTTAVQVTAVGTTVDECLAAMDRATVAIHRRVPVIDGRTCAPVKTSAAQVPRRDDKVHTPDGRPVYYTFTLATLYSTATIP